ncbi:hypothetical protein SATG_01664 [Staphylococcus aureus subsp. aureus D139]|nr:hypothetical protein SATG_01664 [Staphylococcus aureus subsp. aureus D139]
MASINFLSCRYVYTLINEKTGTESKKESYLSFTVILYIFGFAILIYTFIFGVL